jgi:hypothetical protein
MQEKTSPPILTLPGPAFLAIPAIMAALQNANHNAANTKQEQQSPA